MSRGKLIFKYGAMNSGKSLRLLATAFNFSENGIPFILMKSSIDTRDGNGVIHSRALGDMECVTVNEDTDIFELIYNILSLTDQVIYKKLRWILVDESQFLTEKQVEELSMVADNFGVSVMCFGLRTDFLGNLFPGSAKLFALADSIDEIKSSCPCGNKAIMNARIDGNGDIVTEGNQIDVGGNDKYITLCRKCFFDRTGKSKKYKNNNLENL